VLDVAAPRTTCRAGLFVAQRLYRIDLGGPLAPAASLEDTSKPFGNAIVLEKVGIEMELTTMPLFTDDEGIERIVYAWRIAS